MILYGVEIPDEKLVELGWTPPKKKAKKRWRGNENDTYFYVNPYCNVTSSPERWEAVDDARYLLGNYYSSKEEAEKALDKQLAYMRLQDALLEYNDGWEPDRSDGFQDNFFIVYSHYDNCFRSEHTNGYETNGGLFGTSNACKRLIEEHEDDLMVVWGLRN